MDERLGGGQRPRQRDFAVVAPPAFATILPVVMGGVLPLTIIGGMLLSDGWQIGTLAKIWPALLAIPIVLACLLLMRRRSVSIAGNLLQVRAALFSESTPIASIDLERSRVVDLAERTDLRPLLKTMGMSMPGFHAGRFRLRKGFGKAFCLITDRRRVLWLPLEDGKQQLLLSVEEPQALLDAIRAVR